MVGFNFDFEGEEYEQNEAESEIDVHMAEVTTYENALRPENHRLLDMISKLPSQISWSTIEIESPQGCKLLLPRRELFDVRVQLMAEDENIDSKASIEGLNESDIRTNIYEGGFKSWECAFDLAKLLIDRGPRKHLDDLCRVNHIIELGCGTAIPSLVLFRYALRESLPLYFTFTDYNETVLQLVTLPNLMLTYISLQSEQLRDGSLNPLFNLTAVSHGDLEITPQLTKSFIDDLATTNLQLTFISGSWVPSLPFLSLIPTSRDMNTFVLASETIYSPAALANFTAALVGILKEVRLGKAVVAAKRIYFGVGGSVDAFKIECSQLGAVAAEVENHGVDLGEGGVRRCLVEVQML